MFNLNSITPKDFNEWHGLPEYSTLEELFKYHLSKLEEQRRTMAQQALNYKRFKEMMDLAKFYFSQGLIPPFHPPDTRQVREYRPQETTANATSLLDPLTLRRIV